MSLHCEAYAVYSESTDSRLPLKLDTEEMKPYLPNRVFNKREAHFSPGDSISITDPAHERITLRRGVYRINGMSFLTMMRKGKPPVPPVPLYNLTDIYPGYCVLYDAAQPPKEGDLDAALCIGTMGTAYDSGPSLFDCVLEVTRPAMEISLGHQCTYENHTSDDAKAYLRMGGSNYHIGARISIFKIG